MNESQRREMDWTLRLYRAEGGREGGEWRSRKATKLGTNERLTNSIPYITPAEHANTFTDILWA